ncbi:MAG TPA: NAD-dependent epimerase/dehydratase family protein, partial [Chryseosolibacter sp.]|nr:NAD-dependent epimerase/dehydratase family protein [Chryseosolibacter sp.]
MKVVLLGSTGMIGKGVLLECLQHNSIEKVLIINRRPVNMRHEKLTEVIHKDFRDFSGFKDQLKHYDACFFCLGVSSVGMTEEHYREITFDLTLNFAQAMLAANPQAVFCYVS